MERKKQLIIDKQIKEVSEALGLEIGEFQSDELVRHLSSAVRILKAKRSGLYDVLRRDNKDVDEVLEEMEWRLQVNSALKPDQCFTEVMLDVFMREEAENDALIAAEEGE